MVGYDPNTKASTNMSMVGRIPAFRINIEHRNRLQIPGYMHYYEYYHRFDDVELTHQISSNENAKPLLSLSIILPNKSSSVEEGRHPLQL
mgnify:CR=1 FL=1